MPTFDFTSPDGKSYSVQGPDGSTPEQAFQMLQQHIGSAAPQVGRGEDAAKSVASGLGSATIGALGGVGDIRSLLSKGTDLLGSKLGVDLSPVKTAAGMSPLGALNAFPTSEQVKSTVTDPIVSPDYKPQYETGNLAKKGGEFLPGVLLGGPRSLVGKLVTNVAAPAVGSEVGGKLAGHYGGADAGPYGGVAGALVGGAGAASVAQKFNQAMTARNAAKVLPSGEKLVESGSGGFNQARDMNVLVSPDWATNAAAKMRNDLKGFDPEAQSAVFKAADRLENLGKPSSPSMSPAQRLQAEMNWEPTPPRPPAPPVEINEVELIRKQLSSMKTDTNASVREAARKAIASLQESQTALTPAQTVRGDAAAYTQTLKNAIGDYAAGKRSQTIQGKVNLAELNANSPVGALDSGTSGQALQRTMKQLARPVNNTNVPVARKLGFNGEEIAAINKAADGTKMQKTAEVLDRLVPAKLGAIPAAIARQIGGLTTKRQVAVLDSLVRSRSPLAAQVAAQLPQAVKQLSPKTQGLLSSLVASQPILGNQLSGPVGQRPAQ
jgi:hypothetical protein